jgi:hypothetical protein
MQRMDQSSFDSRHHAAPRVRKHAQVHDTGKIGRKRIINTR